MFHNFLLFIPSMLFLLVGLFSEKLLIAGLMLLLFDAIVSVIGQIKIRNAMINSDNPDVRRFTEAFCSSDWMKNYEEILKNETHSVDEDNSEFQNDESQDDESQDGEQNDI